MTLERLFDEHHASLFRFVARITGDADFAKDIVQETFLSVANRPIPEGAAARGWLFQLAQNLARSGLRKVHRRRNLLSRWADGVPGSAPAPRPDVDAERAQARAAVRAALDRLSEKERTILLMREEGFKHREIAEAIGTTTGSVGTMLARALTRLEEQLGDAWREDG